MNKKSVFLSLALSLTLHSAAYAGPFSWLFPEGKSIDADKTLSMLRGEFADAGVTLNIDTPRLKGTTADGEDCSLDVSLVGPLDDQTNTAQMSLFSGSQEIAFDIDPELPSYEVRQLKSAKNVLSLAATETQMGDIIVVLGQPEFSQRTLHRSLQMTTNDDKKIVSVHMKDESGEVICNLN